MCAPFCSNVPYIVPAWASFLMTHFLLASTCTLRRFVNHGGNGLLEEPVRWHCLTSTLVRAHSFLFRFFLHRSAACIQLSCFSSLGAVTDVSVLSVQQ